jgi:hypothetical protein
MGLHRILQAVEYQQNRRFWQPDYSSVIIREVRDLFDLVKRIE